MADFFTFSLPTSLVYSTLKLILFPEDACYLNVVINPGKENSEEQSFQVDKSTEVEFDAMEGYQMYYDYDCTQPMDWIDVDQNKLTVYVSVEPAK